jgi:IS605 OrfB family transposase
MKIVAQLKLLPSVEQSNTLKRTLEIANQTCNQISEMAWESKTFKQFALHHAVYHGIRESTKLTAQMVIRCISKVSDAYKTSKKVQRRFKRLGSVAYDSRILRFYQDKKLVSIWVHGLGRALIPYTAGKRQLLFLQHQAGETDLVFRQGQWFLLTCCDVLEPETRKVNGLIGIDLGVENIVVRSDGGRMSSQMVESKRIWFSNRRATLQSVGTKSAKRRLKKLSGRQARYQRDVNHRISKKLVRFAKRTNRGLALEDLKGINTRTRATSKPNRAKRMNWSFFQLRSFIEYKARGAGVLVVLVNPAYTSQTCNVCGFVSKENRPTQHQFKCLACGFEIHADWNAALNIRDRGFSMIKGHVNIPMVSVSSRSGTSPSL